MQIKPISSFNQSVKAAYHQKKSNITNNIQTKNYADYDNNYVIANFGTINVLKPMKYLQKEEFGFGIEAKNIHKVLQKTDLSPKVLYRLINIGRKDDSTVEPLKPKEIKEAIVILSGQDRITINGFIHALSADYLKDMPGIIDKLGINHNYHKKISVQKPVKKFGELDAKYKFLRTFDRGRMIIHNLLHEIKNNE